MEIVKININHPSSIVISKAVKILKQGGVIVYPTDTAYALGASSFNPKAVRKVYQIKKRSARLPLPFIVAHLGMAKRYAVFHQLATELAKKYWPGPLTISQKSKVKSQKSKVKTIALRVPDCKVARLLSSKLNKPITATSANISRQKECYSIKAVLSQLKDKEEKIDLILDAGVLKKIKPSTIVGFRKGKIVVVREGPVSIDIVSR